MSKARLTGAIVLAAVAWLVLGACAAQDGGNSPGTIDGPSLAANVANPAGDGNAVCSGVSLAYVGTINGQSAALGQNILRAADLAVKQHNQANPKCQVTLKRFDTQGKPDVAPGVVTQVTSEFDIIGVIGLPFSGESKAAGALFNQAALVAISPSATNPALADNGWKTFFRGMGNDDVQGPAAARFLTDTLKANKICVIEDDSEYGVGLATEVTKALGPKASCTGKATTGQTDFSALVTMISAEHPDAVFYSGYYPEAGPFAKQLNEKGITAKFVAPDGAKDPEFVKAAGPGANHAYFTCPCVPEDTSKAFTTAFKQVEGADPGTYSPEGYDVTTILLKGIDSGIRDRGPLLNFVRNYDGQGLTKHFKWDAKGELSDTPVWSYRVENGKIVNNGKIG